MLTDSRCGSACLDFCDVLFAYDKNVIHVGYPTSADSLYMEGRSVPLPSNNGYFTHPRKVYRNRPRGHNQAYIPKFRWNKNSGDTEALQKWIVELAKSKDAQVTDVSHE